MCGFVAHVADVGSGERRKGEITDLAERLRHRGPDDAGMLALDGGLLAHRRLSIIDVDGGHQPQTNEDGRVALACNGEIYNHRELRRELAARHTFRSQSDSEVIVHLYEELGPRCVERLDGMFAFVLVDGERFLAARDPFGIKPLYVGRDDDGLWFASELKAIPASCVEVWELPPGTLMTEKGTSSWFEASWLSTPRARGDRSEQRPRGEDQRALRAALERAVEKRLMSDVPLGVFLSGGLDSSIIAALVRRRVTNLHSFAVGTPGSADLLAARRVAAHLGTRHHEYVYTPDEAARAVDHVILHLESFDAALIESAVPCYFVSKLAAEHVKVVLSGEGSDEVFAGYRYFAELRDKDALHRECTRLLFALHNMNLQRVDRMTMASGLEGRVPFLDVDFVARAMACDPALKLTTAERPEKWLLRTAVADLLPDDIVWRTKVEFADGCGSSEILRASGAAGVTDGDFARRATLFPDDTPTTKQAFAYRRRFEEMYPGPARRATVGRWRGCATEAPQPPKERAAWPTTQ